MWKIFSWFSKKETPKQLPVVQQIQQAPVSSIQPIQNVAPSTNTTPKTVTLPIVPIVPKNPWPDSFENFITNFVFPHENSYAKGHWGDEKYVVVEHDPNDNGSWTMRGIDISGNYDFLKATYGFTMDQAIDYIKNLTAEQAMSIYWNNNYKLSLCSTLSDPLVYCYLDCQINAGPTRAKQFLSASSPKEYNNLRRSFYKRLANNNSTDVRYLDGWLNRVNDLDTFLKIT